MKKQLAVLLSAGILISSIGMSMSPVSEPLIACAEYESEENELLSLINDLRSRERFTSFSDDTADAAGSRCQSEGSLTGIFQQTAERSGRCYHHERLWH